MPTVMSDWNWIQQRGASDRLPAVSLKGPHKAPKDQSTGGTAGTKAALTCRAMQSDSNHWLVLPVLVMCHKKNNPPPPPHKKKKKKTKYEIFWFVVN